MVRYRCDDNCMIRSHLIYSLMVEPVVYNIYNIFNYEIKLLTINS